MVVTSQKREQNLLDVPSALQAFSGDMLEDAGLRDTNDLINMVPDMLMSGEDSGRANIWLRGIGSLAPNQRKTLSEFGIKALIGGALASLLSATIAGMLIG